MKNLYSDRVSVQIFGRQYEIDSSGLTPLEIQSLATFVDERMRDIAREFSIVDTQKVAVLASINIALDYLQLKEKGQSKGNDLTDQLQEMDAVLSQALHQPAHDTLL